MGLEDSSTQTDKKLVEKKKPLYFCTDVNSNVVYSNFKKRGWIEVSNINGMFNLYWTNMISFRRIILNPSYHLRNDQIVNHFPNSYEVSRKDLLLKHFKNYRKVLERKGDPIAEKLPNTGKVDLGGTRYKYLNFLPLSFVLPMEYNMFVEEFNKSPQCTWIIKPGGKSQGIGIFIINKLIQLREWAYEFRNFYQMPSLMRDYYVISKYIEQPLLIEQKKFDIRLFVLVTSFNPIKAFLYNEGFCRFCSEKYDKNLTNLSNRYAHLTNVSIQKNNLEIYNRADGGKWSLEQLWNYLDKNFGETVKVRCIDNIINLIRHTLRAVAPVISSDRHCFELFGFDIIIDRRGKPWLIEVNSSPSIVGTTPEDAAMKTRLIDNMLKVVLPASGRPDIKWDKNPSAEALENFIVLINEEVTLKLNKETSNKVNKIPNTRIFNQRSHWYSNRSYAGPFRAPLRATRSNTSLGTRISIGSIIRQPLRSFTSPIGPRRRNQLVTRERRLATRQQSINQHRKKTKRNQRSDENEMSTSCKKPCDTKFSCLGQNQSEYSDLPNTFWQMCNLGRVQLGPGVKTKSKKSGANSCKQCYLSDTTRKLTKSSGRANDSSRGNSIATSDRKSINRIIEKKSLYPRNPSNDQRKSLVAGVHNEKRKSLLPKGEGRRRRVKTKSLNSHKKRSSAKGPKKRKTPGPTSMKYFGTKIKQKSKILLRKTNELRTQRKKKRTKKNKNSSISSARRLLRD